jgi:peptidyl-dipeptidase Dcp
VSDLQHSFDQAANPLIDRPALPFDAPAFDRIKTEHMLPAVEYGIGKAQAAIAAIKAVKPEEATFENIIEALERADRVLDRISSVEMHIIQTNGTEEQRTLLKEKILPILSALGTDISQDEELFARIKAVHDHCDRGTLTAEQNVLLDKTYKNFVRGGALLTDAEHPAEKQRLREINERLAKLTAEFSDNVTKANAAYERWVDDPAELDGVPERVMKRLAHAAAEKGQPGRWLIQMEPFPGEIFTHCNNRALREEVWRADARMCDGDAFDNNGNILEIVKLRHEMAQLLGYPNYASYVVSDRMTGDTQTVLDFLKRNLAVYKPAAEKELADIKQFAAGKDGSDLQPWDLQYYARLQKEEKFQMSIEELRPYFKLENVLSGLHRHAEKLFNIEIREETSGKYPTHHPDVKTYEIYDKSREIRGVIYTDYFARPGAKKGGAWHMSLITHHEDENGTHIPVTTNTCNFAKPAPGEPALLSPSEAETMFHEFGHALHCLLGEGKYESLTGTKVKRDFVELPSQLQEHWALDKEVLATYAFHHQTGEVIPDRLMQTLTDMKNFGAARMGLGQTFYGLLDMKWYTTDPSTITSVADLEQSVADHATLFPNTRISMSPTFSHIFAGGYAAGYHGYKWAEVLDNDVFSAFQQNGLYDPATAERLRKSIYSRGGTANPMDLFVEMMGRKPDPDALLRSEGLLPPPQPGPA